MSILEENQGSMRINTEKQNNCTKKKVIIFVCVIHVSVEINGANKNH